MSAPHIFQSKNKCYNLLCCGRLQCWLFLAQSRIYILIHTHIFKYRLFLRIYCFSRFVVICNAHCAVPNPISLSFFVAFVIHLFFQWLRVRSGYIMHTHTYREIFRYKIARKHSNTEAKHGLMNSLFNFDNVLMGFPGQKHDSFCLCGFRISMNLNQVKQMKIMMKKTN